MKIQVRYFAVFRERLAREQEVVEVPANTTVRGALDVLEELHPSILELRGRYRAAVNQDFVDDDTVLSDGDELALIPPVAGGQDGPYARMVETPPSLDRVVAQVAGPDQGGVVTFTGMVRRRSQGRDVVRLEYEAYGEMAEKEMAAVVREIEAELPGTRVAIEHRAGVLTVGDIAVAIAASAPHRAEAFAACRAAIDRLKDRAPIWKKEVGPDGAEWVGLGP